MAIKFKYENTEADPVKQAASIADIAPLADMLREALRKWAADHPDQPINAVAFVQALNDLSRAVIGRCNDADMRAAMAASICHVMIHETPRTDPQHIALNGSLLALARYAANASGAPPAAVDGLFGMPTMGSA